MSGGGKKKVCLQLDCELYRQVKIQAIMHDVAAVAFVESALRDYIDRLPIKHAKHGGGAAA